MSWIEATLVAVLTASTMAVVGRKNKAMPEFEQGMLRFRLPKVFVVMGGISILIAMLFAFGALKLATSEWYLSFFLGAMTVAFGYMGVILFRDGKNYAVVCSEESIAVISGQHRFEACLWSDLLSARVHPLSKYILLRTNDGRTLKINAYLIGSNALFNIMARNTKFPVMELVAKARAIG